ncbi:hypothetical protein HDG32_004652 [Paraburkholderia sp. CI2]|uniref:hypothetical protein n=1 Tax=Paraburkholderia sp. CI2 TaxID=2723093 RepID=UPI0017A52598|nr:hypothetical protein [Paraburkholderia sp. CI2]
MLDQQRFEVLVQLQDELHERGHVCRLRVRWWRGKYSGKRAAVPRFGEAIYNSLAEPRQLMVVKAAEHNDWMGRVDETWWREAIGFLLTPSH